MAHSSFSSQWLVQCWGVFWIYAEDTVDNIEKFLLQLRGTYTEPRPSLTSHTTLPVSRLGVLKTLRGDTARQRIPTGHRDIPCHMASS